MFLTHDEFRKKRRLSQQWIKTNSPWLTNSKLFDKRFCLPCVIFALASRGSGGLGVLVSGPFYKATEILRRHQTYVNVKKLLASFNDDTRKTKRQLLMSIH